MLKEIIYYIYVSLFFKMLKIAKRNIYYSCDKKKYFTNRLYKKVCSKCLSLNINNLNNCVYCNNILNDNDIRLIKNTIFTDIINVRKDWKGINENIFKSNKNLCLLNNVEIDDRYIHLRNGLIINKNKKLYVYYNCYDYIILNNPYSNSCLNLIVLFKGIIYDMKNLKRKNICCLLHMYNYIYFIIDILLYFLVISKGKYMHYKYMYNKNIGDDKDYNEEALEILYELNKIIKEKKKNISVPFVNKEKENLYNNNNNINEKNKKEVDNIYESKKDLHNINEKNIIEILNENYEDMYKDILNNIKKPILNNFFNKLQDANIKNKIKAMKKHLYIGCSYPSPLNHFSIQVLFPPFSNYNFFQFPFYYSIEKILHDLYIYGHVKNYNHSEIIKNIYNDKLMKGVKESDMLTRTILQYE